jgi:polysaccharide export outer membrane protein
MRISFILSVALLCSSSLRTAAQEQPTPAAQGDQANAQANANSDSEKSDDLPVAVSAIPRDKQSSLQLGVGDLVELTVYDVPELTSKTRISSTGDLYCPLIGPTHVAGLTSEEAAQLIQKRLSAYLKDPYVSLFVTEYASQGASLLGEVAKPGVYPVLGEQHLFDLISAAGGLSEKAGQSLTLTHRSDPDKQLTLPLSRNLSDHPESNVRVFPGDTVYVVGDVSRPSGLLMNANGITVLEAVALAGGTTRTAKLNGAKILHKGPDGMTETPVQLKKMLRAQAPDLTLQANDILVVPSSAGKILAGRTLEAAMQAATMVSVVAVP